MEIDVHFEAIQDKIINHLNRAKYSIFVAVAWITDQILWDLLLQKASDGLNVQVILNADEINQNNKFGFEKFINAGGQIFWLDHHHKFCVIDLKCVITGSYNWTNMAIERGNREHVLILNENYQTCEKFSDEFKLLLKTANKHILPKEIEFITIEKEVPKIEVVEKIEIKTVYLEKPDYQKLKPTFIAKFNSPYVICACCNTALNKGNVCPECKRNYKYNDSLNRYQTFD